MVIVEIETHLYPNVRVFIHTSNGIMIQVPQKPFDVRFVQAIRKAVAIVDRAIPRVRLSRSRP